MTNMYGLFKLYTWAGEMAQCLRVLIVLTEDQGFQIPPTQ